jgi:hypothetical protein
MNNFHENSENRYSDNNSETPPPKRSNFFDFLRSLLRPTFHIRIIIEIKKD